MKIKKGEIIEIIGVESDRLKYKDLVKKILGNDLK